MVEVPEGVTLAEVAHGDDAGLVELFEFTALHGTPRTTDPDVYRELMAPCSAWRCVVARRDGELVAATQASINEVLGLDQVQLNAFFAPGHEDAFHAALDDAGRWGLGQGAPRSTAHVIDPSDAAIAGWLSAGFEHVGDRARVARNVTPQDAAIAPVRLDGVQVVALAERPELEDPADALWKAGHADIPSALGFAEGALPGFRTELDLAADDPIPSSLLLALDGDDVVGLAVLLQLESTPGVAGHRFTTVTRSHRGRGIARALKVELIRWAAVNGVGRLQASNDDGNAPMRAINDALDYEPVYRIVLLRRTLR